MPNTGVPPGGVRSVFTAGDPTNFDVMFHANTGTPARGYGQFQMADYHKGVEKPLPPSQPPAYDP